MRHRYLIVAVALIISNVALTRAKAEISEAEATAFAKKIEASLAHGDASVFDAAIDTDAIATTALAGLNPSPAIIAQFKASVAANRPGTTIAQQIKPKGSYHFLHVTGTPAQQKVLFRMLGRSGLNYHELLLASDPNGQIRVNDIEIFIAGEKLTQTYHRVLVPLVAQANRGVVAKLFAGDADLIKYDAEIRKFEQFNKTGQAQEAINAFDSFPTSLQHEKAFLIPMLSNVQRVDKVRYLKMLEDYQRQFPNDPGAVLVSIDAYLLKKDYPNLLRAIDQLDRQVGGDPHLQSLRAVAYLGENDHPSAKAALMKAIKAEPFVRLPYYTLIKLSLDEKDYDGTVRLLNLTETRTGMRFADNLNNAASYSDFMKTAQYRKWLAGRKPASAPTSAPAAGL